MIAFAVSTLCSCSQKIELSAREVDWLTEHKHTIRLASGLDFPPMSFLDENGIDQGIAPEYQQIIARKLGVTIERVPITDWKEGHRLVKSGKIDIFSTQKSKKNKDNFELTKTYLEIPNVVITRRGYKIDFELINKMAVVNEYHLAEYIRDNHQNINLIPATSNKEALEMLLLGQVDACGMDMYSATDLLEKEEYSLLNVSSPIDFANQISFGVLKKNAVLAGMIDKALDSISFAERQKIRSRWIQLEDKPPERLANLTFIIVILIFTVIYLIFRKKINKFLLKQYRLIIIILIIAILGLGSVLLYNHFTRQLRLTREERQWLNQNVLSFAKCIDAPPIAFFNPNGEYVGAAMYYTKLLIKRADARAEWICLEDWADLTEAFEAGEISVTIMQATAETKQSFSFTDPIFHIPFVLITRQNERDPLTLADLKGKKLIVSKGLYLEGYVREHYPDILIETVSDDQAGLLKVSFEKDTIYGGNLAFCSFIIERLGITNLKVSGETGLFTELSFATQKENTYLFSILNKFVGSLSQKEKNQITDRWFKGSRESGFDKRILFFIVLAFITVSGTGLLILIWNLTLRRTVHRQTLKIRKNEELFSLAMDAANIVTWDLNLDTMKINLSPNFYKSPQYKPGDSSASDDIWNLSAHPDDKELTQARFIDYISGKTKVFESEFRIQTEKGDWRWILSRGRIVEKDKTGNPLRMLGIHTDITKKKLAEIALKESEEIVRVTLNSIGDAVIATDINGIVTQMNPVAQQLTGWTKNEAVGQPLEEVFHIVNAVTNNRVTSPVEKVITTGKIIDLANHTVLIARDGTRYQIADSGSPIRNDNNKIIGMVLVFRDETAANKMQTQLRQSQKMQAVGVLAGGIAHDFNNILTAVMGFTSLARLEAGDQEPMKEYLDSITAASLRARDLVKQILKFSRVSEVKQEIVDITLILKETLEFFRSSLPANIEIRQEINAHKAWIMCDPTQFHQILMNLFTNAGYAMKNSGGVLEVVLDTRHISRDDAQNFNRISPGQYFQLTVSDTGTGIPKSIIDRVFEPFFTTKQREEGTGLGLSTVYGILKNMGGSISVYSEENSGTIFKVLIPEGNIAELPQKSLDLPLVEGKGKILVVDDEAAIVTSTEKLLTKLGYTVTALTNSQDALDKIQSNPRYFDLVLTDMTMPGMNGLELSKSIQLINKDIPIVLCTGFSKGLTKEICTSAGIIELIMKPLIAEELSMTIHRAIQSRPGSKTLST